MKNEVDVYDERERQAKEDRKRLSRLLMRSRGESGLSQEAVSLELGIAKKTVQNWEKGVSAPSLPQAIAWFRLMGVPAMPYLIQFIFPEMEGTKGSDDDEKIRKELLEVVQTLPVEAVRQLFYLFYGDHGSSPRGVMNMLTAHLQTPLKDRFAHASTILADYKLSHDKHEVSRPDHIQPNLDLLEKAIEQGREAILQNRENYLLLSEDERK